MNSIYKKFFFLAISYLPLIFPLSAKAIPAFPGAEGFGAETIGGRGGKIYEITNLNDSGSGSLRECVQATGARICIFKIGGSITLISDLTISNPYITIAGQTAPGGGILLRKNGGSGDLIHITTHDVVIRYLTLRRGPPSNTSDVNGLSIYKNNGTDIYNIIIDHCSMSWTNDRILFSWYGPRDFTVQWSMFTEPLDCNKNSKGCQSAKAVMLGSGTAGEGSTTPGAKNITFHHNLITDCGERCPLIKPAGLADVINNISYNTYWSYASSDSDLQVTDFYINYIGNYFRKGPAGDPYGIKASNIVSSSKELYAYVFGNIDSHRTYSTQSQTAVVDSKMISDSHITITAQRNASTPPVSVTESTCNTKPSGNTIPSGCDVYDQIVLRGMAGNNLGLNADGSFFTRRDAVDLRKLEEVKSSSGKVIDAAGPNSCASGSTCRTPTISDYTKWGIDTNEIDQTDTWFNGWPVIANGTPYPDTDHDGMSDTWETAQGLNPNTNDSAGDNDGDGYTNIEEFLNGTGTAALSTPTPSPIALIGDVNSDRIVNILDFTLLSNAFSSTNTASDLNKDGIVNILDFTLLSNNFGKSI
jgi:pectate lyase